MKARALIGGASFDTKTITTMAKALDEVWAELGANFDTPLSAELARLGLADAILANAAVDGHDIGTLKEAGRRWLAIKYLSLIL